MNSPVNTRLLARFVRETVATGTTTTSASVALAEFAVVASTLLPQEAADIAIDAERTASSRRGRSCGYTGRFSSSMRVIPSKVLSESACGEVQFRTPAEIVVSGRGGVDFGRDLACLRLN